MKILVMGAGKMGSFFIDLLSFEHEVAVYERDAKRMRFTYNCQRFTSYDEIKEFKPELLINAVTLKYTIPVFKEVMPFLPKDCIISDIASVKTDMKEFYEQTGMRYVSGRERGTCMNEKQTFDWPRIQHLLKLGIFASLQRRGKD